MSFISAMLHVGIRINPLTTLAKYDNGDFHVAINHTISQSDFDYL